jgi:hypothetical protein
MVKIASTSIVIYGRNGQASMEQTLIYGGKDFEIFDLVAPRASAGINKLIENYSETSFIYFCYPG